MKKKKYLDLYHEWLKTGLPAPGLCHSLNHYEKPDELFSLLIPLGYLSSLPMYWGFDGDKYTEAYREVNITDKVLRFTPLRQNIVLLMAAMNGEL